MRLILKTVHWIEILAFLIILQCPLVKRRIGDLVHIMTFHCYITVLVVKKNWVKALDHRQISPLISSEF